jgi:hypothetical protein
MRAADTGLYHLGHASPLTIGVNLSATRLTLVAFKPIDRLERPVILALDALAATLLDRPSRAGTPEVFYEAHAIEDPSAPGTLLAYCSHVIFDLADLKGADEVVDFSRFEVPVDRAGMLATWDNRLITSRWDKNEFGQRNRAKRGSQIACYVWMPIATGSFHDCRIILPNLQVFGFGGTADPVLLGPEEATSDGRGYLRFYWSVRLPEDLTVSPEAWIEIPLHLAENADGTPLAHSTHLKLEALSGYVAQTRVVTDAEGRAVIRACALGLRAGDTLSIKINTDHYTAVGRVDVAVV